jgi:oligo-1,6-glucosidase
MGRDNARTPMQWDDSPHAGFTTGTPWLAVNPNYAEINAKAAVEDPDSVLHHYRKLIELRHRLEVVRDGEFVLLAPDDPRIYAFTRGAELLVAANFSAETVEFDTPGELLLSNYRDSGTGRLRPWEARITRTAGA